MNDIDTWKREHGITEAEQQELFGAGAVGDVFLLAQEMAPGSVTQAQIEAAAVRARDLDLKQGRMF